MKDLSARGSSSSSFRDPRPGRGRAINIHLHQPDSWSPENPVLMVMHGRKRNGAEYRDYFVAEANRRGLLLVAPEFPEAEYANPHAYNYGDMCDANEKPLPSERWLFPVLD